MGYEIEMTNYRFQIAGFKMIYVLRHLLDGTWSSVIDRLYTGGFCTTLRPEIVYNLWKDQSETTEFMSDLDRHWFLLDTLANGARWNLLYYPMRGEHVCGIAFNGHKAGGEEDFLREIAPWVEPDSFIEMRGEDGKRWVYRFDGRTMKTYDIQETTKEVLRCPGGADIADTEDTLARGL